jgi:anti-anti-sigma regulatory factor
MLRITTRNRPETTCFIIEGRLAGPLIMELDRCWQAAISNEPHTSILVDLTGTTCIDAQGKELLARMHQQGAKLTGTGLMTKFIIREIESAMHPKCS